MPLDWRQATWKGWELYVISRHKDWHLTDSKEEILAVLRLHETECGWNEWMWLKWNWMNDLKLITPESPERNTAPKQGDFGLWNSKMRTSCAQWDFCKSIKKFFYVFILFWALRGLCCCVGLSLVAMHRFLTAVAALVAEHRMQGMRASVFETHGLWSPGSVVVAHGLSSSAAGGIFLNQGSNPFLLHWQVDSLLLSHQGSPQ